MLPNETDVTLPPVVLRYWNSKLIAGGLHQRGKNVAIIRAGAEHDARLRSAGGAIGIGHALKLSGDAGRCH